MKNILNKLKSLDKGTIARTILLILGWANQIVAIIGSTTFATATWYQILSACITIAISVVTYWYNNDWSHLAIMSRDFFDMMKDGRISEEEATKFIEDHKIGDKK